MNEVARNGQAVYGGRYGGHALYEDKGVAKDLSAKGFVFEETLSITSGDDAGICRTTTVGCEFATLFPCSPSWFVTVRSISSRAAFEDCRAACQTAETFLPLSKREADIAEQLPYARDIISPRCWKDFQDCEVTKRPNE